ncbi:MAG TPA: hypothetical protein VGX21_01445 [Methylomirabilota bacterium]|jgi:hypothetical protein|nr:hypothetical protein [Methylomirabilota bacterium]
MATKVRLLERDARPSCAMTRAAGFRAWFVAFVVLGASAGCATSIPLTKQSRETTSSVSVKEDVSVPDQIYYHGPGQSLGMALGVVGVLVAEAAAQGPKGQLKAAMKEGHIDLGQIVREQFAAALTEAAVFPAIIADGGEAEFQLEVRIFGFARPPGFSSRLKPMLGVKGTLARRDGPILWQKYDYVTNLADETPSHTLEEYLQTPKLIEESLTAAAKIVARELMKDMRQK